MNDTFGRKITSGQLPRSVQADTARRIYERASQPPGSDKLPLLYFPHFLESALFTPLFAKIFKPSASVRKFSSRCQVLPLLLILRGTLLLLPLTPSHRRGR